MCLVQWNPVNTVTNGWKKLAVLTGWPYYRGRLKFLDLMAVMTNLTPYSAFAFLEQLFSRLLNNWNVDIAYRQIENKQKKNYLKFPFSTYNTFGYKIATSALF